MEERVVAKFARLIGILFVCLMGIYCLISIHYYDVDKATTYLTDHAQSQSKHECARYVRLAIQAGGCLTYIHPASAKEYDAFLPKLGFTEISTADYTPLAGDIIVIKLPQNAKGHEHGHIAMYNGQKWISDFKQRDMYGGNIYRKKGTEYYLFRRSSGWGIRKWIL